MAEKRTEERHSQAVGLDLLADRDFLALLARGQSAAATAVVDATDAIAAGARLASETIASGGRVIYAAAGSSGLMALADALELPGTYGIARHQIVVLLAGGPEALVDMRGGPEDDSDAARAAVDALSPNENDCLIAVTASGRTPYPLAAAEAARRAGAKTIGIANNAGAELFTSVDVAICLATPPEVIAGSTRMGAATAQKIALNMLSTLMAVHLGHVHDGFMVNVVADNEKLRARARSMVSAVSGGDEAQADAALKASDGAIKPAILLASGVATLAEAEALLIRHAGRLRPALADIG